MFRTEDKPFYDLSPHHILALLAWGEARGEGNAGQVAVMNVVKNRANHGGWFLDSGILSAGLSKYHAVILKNAWVEKLKRNIYQFSCFQEDDANRSKLLTMAKGDSIPTPLLDMASMFLNWEGIEDNTNGALYYYNSKVCSPAWAKTMKVTADIGNHLFLT